ncbi:hypothetical protein BBD40_28445 [Paenibacillus ihbetae]|uniref:Uncharacterized protein n=1 Tax=Paenibacillus ihbetae TaxID=1870820 RepID=A0ABX3JMQ4_9BACL|nr:hypothetical protein BBD40_28445 [Paenibacillus ihbetae]
MGETQPRIRWRRWLGVALVVLIMAVVAGWAQSYYSKKFFIWTTPNTSSMRIRAAVGSNIVQHLDAETRLLFMQEP